MIIGAVSAGADKGSDFGLHFMEYDGFAAISFLDSQRPDLTGETDIIRDLSGEVFPWRIEYFYEPTYIPDGYWVHTKRKSVASSWYIYINGEGSISFSQDTLDHTPFVNTEGSSLECVTIRDRNYYYLKRANSNSIIFFFEYDAYMFMIHSDRISVSEVIKIAESIV